MVSKQLNDTGKPHEIILHKNHLNRVYMYKSKQKLIENLLTADIGYH